MHPLQSESVSDYFVGLGWTMVTSEEVDRHGALTAMLMSGEFGALFGVV